VSDIVQANVSALIQDLSPGAILNVGSGTEVTVFDVANSLADALGVTPLFEDCGEFRVGDIHACVADLSQTLDKLNYKPTVSLEEGMREFASWANDKRSIDQYQKTVDELKAFGLFGRSQLSDKP
jgi:dTDP-L-rhamnose 4-epimerase